ncbi:uncharacterized protein LOC142580321 isoform X2 [Dermacentor variabilis]|uniref:uncharacterized protein LOC142580321 isoform X2 n=1 Tax=Dermacentor variabilis TaxID=34621 RepID=UPI003F5B6DDB
MTVQLQCLFVNALFFVVGAYRRPKIMLPGSATPPHFPRCSDAGDIVEGCLEKMTSFLTRARGGRSKDMKHEKMKFFLQGSTDFQNCLLHRQELTLREYAAWCEHKSSVARKVAVCYRYLIDKHTKSISETVLSEGIEKLQDCILNEQDESMEHSKKMSHKWKRELPKASQPIEPEEPTEMEPVEKEEMEPEPSLVFPDQDYRKEMPRGRRPKRSWKHRPRPSSGYMPHRRPDWKQTQAEHGGGMWSYPLHDQTYYYPRREKGLGNETAQSANTEAETPPRTTKVPGPITRPLVTTPPTTKLPPTTRK